MDKLKENIRESAKKFLKEIIDIRRHLHQFPELSFQEYKTSEYICKKLDDYKIPYKKGFVKTGIVGKIEGNNPSSKIIALRADMDALPVLELNKTSYSSKNRGVMHACGHDVHVSSLLGTARILNQFRHHFQGTILILFQPGEEKIPGGAKQMIEEGALNNPAPDIVIGQHVMPGLQSGKAAFKPGMTMASVDEIYLTVKGKGGHAAMPDQNIDPILIASHIIVSLQQIVSRLANPMSPTVLSFGKIESEGAANVIPSEVKVSGTFRTMNEEWRYDAHQKIKHICSSVAEGMGGNCEVEIREGYPFLENNDRVTEKARKYAEEILGKENVVNLQPEMTAEDFAYYARKFPATFYRLGISGKNDENTCPLHSPRFSVDENALLTGMQTMSWIAMKFLTQ
jgi:amidohydrolase